MKKTALFLLAMVLFISCHTSHEKDVAQSNSRLELLPEPDKDLRLKSEAIEKLKKSGCIIDEPNMSVNGLKLGDSNSAASIIAEKDKIDESGQYHFYSKLEAETLTLTQHPGDIRHQISIIRVANSDKLSRGYRQLNTDGFKTEKGIKLGMSKKEVISKLGKCYAAIDSTQNYIELYYLIESPNDTKSKILEKNNIPSYYGSYKFRNDKLDIFEFGFEYP